MGGGLADHADHRVAAVPWIPDHTAAREAAQAHVRTFGGLVLQELQAGTREAAVV